MLLLQELYLEIGHIVVFLLPTMNLYKRIMFHRTRQHNSSRPVIIYFSPVFEHFINSSQIPMVSMSRTLLLHKVKHVNIRCFFFLFFSFFFSFSFLRMFVILRDDFMVYFFLLFWTVVESIVIVESIFGRETLKKKNSSQYMQFLWVIKPESHKLMEKNIYKL